jgi:hypothetical protein
MGHFDCALRQGGVTSRIRSIYASDETMIFSFTILHSGFLHGPAKKARSRPDSKAS